MERDLMMDLKGLETVYEQATSRVRAVDGVSLSISRGEKLGIAGESGCGKSTLILSLLRLVPPPGRITKGEILYYGWEDSPNILSLPESRMRRYRWEQISIVFQAAQSALNPVMRIGDHFVDTFDAHGIRDRDQAYDRARDLLKRVRLNENVLDMYPHQLSGGMKQRVIIALSLILNPKVLILDEPTSALDLLTQKHILDMIKEIGERLGLTMIFVTHDISLLAEIATRIAIMYAGKIVEIAPVQELFYHPRHPYTIGLMKAIPSLIGDITSVTSISGRVPDLTNPPPGCRFHPRCPHATETCESVEPELENMGNGCYIACHRRGEF